MKFKGTDNYISTDDLSMAVNAAIELEKPLLIKGEPGTGKTMLACYAAIEGLNDGDFNKIILTRPAVSVEEDIGYLPGTLEEKMDPWTRPIMDIFSEFYSQHQIANMIREKIIEICPLAYMRGRTFDNAFIIIDEAQNTTAVQMKMILTRIGHGSRMVVNGDLSQIDIPKGISSGLSVALQKLKKVKKIKIVELSQKDVVRHPLVAEIINAYDKK